MKPKLSFINSVCSRGLQSTAELVKKVKLQYVDLYAFMQNDLEILWPESRVQGRRNALYEMAAALDHLEDLERIAGIIEQHIGSAKVAAFATYIPEITIHSSNDVAQQAAQKALSFLVHLAAFLNSKGHPVNTIEIVGGNSVDGLWRGNARGGFETYVVNRLKKEDSLSRLITRLLPVAEVAYTRPKPIRLALELEPGPLFNLGAKESLLEFCRRLDAIANPVSNVIGLNLDIPHWCFLAEVDAVWVRHHEVIRRRIVHAHISDHSKGHFCDSEPLLFHGGADFAPWLQLLAELADKAPENAPLGYSGFLACELECCPNDKLAKKCGDTVRELIDRYCA